MGVSPVVSEKMSQNLRGAGGQAPQKKGGGGKIIKDPVREGRVRSVALFLGDLEKFSVLHLHYCSGLTLSYLAKVFKKSYNKLKNSISKASEIYDLEYICRDIQIEKLAGLMPFFKEVDGRFKCLHCGRYVTRRGRVQHILSKHRDLVERYV